MSQSGLFASVAREYASFRPGYPPELFEWLARACESRGAAWDCGCGSGQASTALAEHFEVVHATDVSPEQIASAHAHPRVRYRVAPAESSGLEPASVDLVTVAQALHWFDLEAFYAEARRVAARGAVLAVWTYPRPEIADKNLDRVFVRFYSETVGPYWPAERRHVESHYRALAFPFEELPHPPFGLQLRWSLEQLLGYVGSWSATARYRKEQGMDPVPFLREALMPLWPAGGAATVHMPLVLKAAKIASATPPG